MWYSAWVVGALVMSCNLSFALAADTPPIVVFQGGDSQAEGREYHQILTQKELNEVFRKVGPKGRQQTFVDVDFTKYMAVVVCYGKVSYVSSLTVTTAAGGNKDSTIVRFQAELFSTEAGGPELVSHPYAIIVLPKVRQVAVEQNVGGGRKDAPVWRRLVEFEDGKARTEPKR